MIPTHCPCGNTSLSQMPYSAPNEAWCGSCDGIVEQQDDGTTKVWSGTRLLTEGI